MFVIVLCSGCPKYGRFRQRTRLPVINITSEPISTTATVARVEGTTLVQAGERCRISVARTDHRRLNCRVDIMCGSDRLFGHSSQTFCMCEQRGRRLVYARSGTGKYNLERVKMRLYVEDQCATVADNHEGFRVTLTWGNRDTHAPCPSEP